MRQFMRDFFEEYNREVPLGNKRVPKGLLSILQVLNAGAKGDIASARFTVQMAERFSKVFDTKNKKSVESLDFFEEHNADQGLERTDRNVAKLMNSMRKRTRDL